MAETRNLAEPKDLEEAKGQISGLAKELDASQERVGELDGKLTEANKTVEDFEGQIKTLQENNDAAGKDMAEAAEKIAEGNDLKEANATLTKERDEALDKLDVSEKALEASQLLTKGAAVERKKQNELKKKANVKFAYIFNEDPGYASMVLCGIQVEPKDGIWMLTDEQYKEAAGHGVEPQRAKEVK